MSDLLIRLLRIRLPVPKRMFDFWIGLFSDIVKASTRALAALLFPPMPPGMLGGNIFLRQKS